MAENSVVAVAGSARGTDPTGNSGDCRTAFLISLGLAVMTLAVFGQTLQHDFINYDDNGDVYDNPTIAAGLTLKGIASAFSHAYSDNWVPLTAISHMLDCQFYGLNAGGHHLTNVLLHAASAILLFLVLRQMTGTLWRSAFVAAIFAVHPLHVESVAWVAERKDVLSGLFFMLTLWAYLRYVREPQSFVRYLMVGFLFALGLMSKPMLVTLPFILLLLDYWPLNRFQQLPPVEPAGWLKSRSIPARLIVEKIPLLLLSAISCLLTVLAQGNAIKPLNEFSLSVRIGNAAVSCVTYLEQMFCPVKLAVFYPYPSGGLSLGEILLAFMVLAGISLGVVFWRQSRPHLLAGWLWYLGMLIPVIGLVQVGVQAHGDRYTYLPQIGLYLMIAWSAAEFFSGWRHRRLVLGGLAATIIVVLAHLARLQASYWKNSELLWTHTLECTADNSVAHDSLGNVLLQNGRVDDAILQFEQALVMQPNYANAHGNLGNALLQKGRVDEAILQCQKALALQPDLAEALNNLGNALLQKGQADESILQFQKALAIRPDYPDAQNNLAGALFQKGRADEAILLFQKVLAIRPGHSQTHYNLGNVLFQEGWVDEAIIHYQQALAIQPGFAEAHNNLGNALIQKGRADEAITHYQQALAIEPRYAEAHYNLGNALLQNGRTKEAILHYQEGLAIQPDNAKARNNLGTAFLRSGQFDEAILQFQKALAIQPDYPQARSNLGNALRQKGN